MTLMKHEMRQGKISLLVWTISIAFLIAMCIMLFPEMKGEMDSVSKLFASMGSFSSAFGMDKVNFGTLLGFYVVECGNILGLGGAFFASLCAVTVLAKEEKDRTSEFLLTHPVSRARIVGEKFCAVVLQIVIMNLLVFGVSVASVALIGEKIPWKELGLLHLAYFLLQLELAGICFGISAFLRRGSMGIGLGIAVLMYFLNLIANIADSAKFLKYITPFGYVEGADIVTDSCLNGVMVAIGMVLCILGVAAAFYQYCRKDIQ